MIRNSRDITESQPETNEQTDIDRASPADTEETSDSDYMNSSAPMRSLQIIDLLREIRASQVVHEQTAATKDDIQDGNEAVISALSIQNAELRNGLERLKAHLDVFSVRTITTVISLILVAFSTVLLLVTLLKGPVLVSAPLPHLLLIFSIGLYLMARKLPGRSV